MASPFGSETMDYGTVTGRGSGFNSSSEFVTLKERVGNTVMEIQQNTKKLNQDRNKLGGSSDTDEFRGRMQVSLRGTFNKVQAGRSMLIQLVHLSKSSNEKGQELAVKMLQQSMTTAINEFQRASQEVLRAMENAGEPFRARTPLSESATLSDTVDVNEYDDRAQLVKGGQVQQQQLVVSDDINYVEVRAERMEQVETDIRALNDIMVEIGGLVTDQGEIIDHIEGNVEVAHGDVIHANQQLEKGVRLKKCSRKLMCVICSIVGVIVLILVIIVIAVIVHFTGGKKKQ